MKGLESTYFTEVFTTLSIKKGIARGNKCLLDQCPLVSIDMATEGSVEDNRIKKKHVIIPQDDKGQQI